MASKKSSPARRGPLRRLILRLLLLVSLLLGFALAFFRLQGVGPVTDKTRALNKRLGNPTMMRLAGRRYFFAGVIRHTGRRSGREYATPIWAVPTHEGVVISLPFGEGVDWLKNVLAAGRATIEAKGKIYDVVEPVVIGAAEAFPLLDERHRRTWRRFGIERFLRLKRVQRDPGAPRWEELRRFRATHPAKHTTVGGLRWGYIVSGVGEEAFLILPGGAMVGEAGFTRIPAFEYRYRVIAPSYASVSTAAGLLDGLAGVLDAEGVEATHVLGPSYGGIVAQGFVRRHPNRVKSIVLANTLVPPRRMLQLSKVFLALLRLVPVHDPRRRPHALDEPQG